MLANTLFSILGLESNSSCLRVVSFWSMSSSSRVCVEFPIAEAQFSTSERSMMISFLCSCLGKIWCFAFARFELDCGFCRRGREKNG